MCPAKVEVNGRHIATIVGVDQLDIIHPLNPLAFGGRVSYYGDEIGYASIIGPEGDTVGKVLHEAGDALTMTVDLSALLPDRLSGSYTITATRT